MPAFTPSIPFESGIEYSPGPVPALDEQSREMVVAKVLEARLVGKTVYVGGLCPRCGHSMTIPPIPVGVIGVRSTSVVVICGCGEKHGRQSETGCGLVFGLDYA